VTVFVKFYLTLRLYNSLQLGEAGISTGVETATPGSTEVAGSGMTGSVTLSYSQLNPASSGRSLAPTAASAPSASPSDASGAGSSASGTDGSNASGGGAGAPTGSIGGKLGLLSRLLRSWLARLVHTAAGAASSAAATGSAWLSLLLLQVRATPLVLSCSIIICCLCAPAAH
jgi:hypothetical protein